MSYGFGSIKLFPLVHRFIPMNLIIFDVMVGGIVFLLSLLDSSLLIAVVNWYLHSRSLVPVQD